VDDQTESCELIVLGVGFWKLSQLAITPYYSNVPKPPFAIRFIQNCQETRRQVSKVKIFEWFEVCLCASALETTSKIKEQLQNSLFWSPEQGSW